MTPEVVAAIKNADPYTLIEKLKSVLIDFTPRLLGVLIFLAVSHIVIKGLSAFLKNILKKSKIDPTLHSFILGVLKYSIWIIVMIIALIILGIPTTPLVTIMGSVGLALSLALKDSLANVAGGISILFSRPFDKNDSIDVKSYSSANGFSGTVKKIDLFYTQIITDDGDMVYLPNGDVSKSVVTNHSRKKNPPPHLTGKDAGH